jgi:serine/threonine-protein kinase
MLQPGTQIGRYEIQRRLGRGGMGTVYVAHDPVLGRMVAIKICLSALEMADAADRFTREARSAAALNHANIVTIHDFGDVSLQPYIVMEYVQGETVAEIIKRKAPVPVPEKLRWMEELCAGAAYAHQLGVIHRDLKPTNLMIDRSGRLKILDFGIAKMLGTLGTNATALIGTPGYMAPEQILGGSIDARSDLFSIGVVCYELLAYTEAFPGETIPAITHRIVSEEPVALPRLVPDVHPELVQLVERALKKSAADRFPDAESFRVALARVRRQLESETGWEPTLITPRVPGSAAPGSGRIGTGSARRQVPNVAGVAELTPPPEPRKTDKEEALKRRRAAQIAAALEQARRLLAAAELDDAYEACQQALTLDESCAEALELEAEIQVLRTKRQADALLATARDELQRGALTAALGFLHQARALDPDAPEGKRLERDLRLARAEQERLRQRAHAVSQALTSGAQALERGDIEGALACARQALELDPESADAQTLEAHAMRRLDEVVALPTVHLEPAAVAPPADKTVVAPKRPTPAVARKTGPASQPPAAAARPPSAPRAPRTDPWVALRGWTATVKAAAASAHTAVRARVGASTKRQKQTAAIAAGAAAIVLVAVAAFFLIPSAPAPTGTLVIEALPWASIRSIESADGVSQPLPAGAATPLAITLPAGSYIVRLGGPGPDTAVREVRVDVRADGTVVTAAERFGTVTPEEYFEQYLPPLAQPPAPSPAAEPAQETPPTPPGGQS